MSKVLPKKEFGLWRLTLTVLTVGVATYFALKAIDGGAEKKCVALHCDQGKPKLIRGERYECLCVVEAQ